MGIFFGILCLICFCLLSAKAVTAKLRLKKIDRALTIVHKPVSVFLIIMCFIHIIYVVPILINRNELVILSGIASVVFMILLICFCHIIKGRKKKLLWHRILTILMAISITGHFMAYIIDFNNYQKNSANIGFDDINFVTVQDGIYKGEYDAGYIYAKVEIKVKDGIIISINLLEHRNERGANAESIINDIILKQKIDVDTVSGATNSSNVIKKAIENAMKSGN